MQATPLELNDQSKHSSVFFSTLILWIPELSPKFFPFCQGYKCSRYPEEVTSSSKRQISSSKDAVNEERY